MRALEIYSLIYFVIVLIILSVRIFSGKQASEIKYSIVDFIIAAPVLVLLIQLVFWR